jgi:hypothetical protein
MIVQTETGSDSFLGKIFDMSLPQTEQQITSGGESGVAMNAIGFSDIADIVLGLGVFWYPAIFQGVYVWAWAVLFMPIGVAFWVTMGLAMVRGVSSG